MDIERLSQIGSSLDTRLKKKKDSEKIRTGKGSRTAFGRVLEHASEGFGAEGIAGIRDLPALDASETLESLLDDVHEAGDALKRDPVFGPLKGYKQAVRRFLKYVLDNGLEAEEIVGIRNPRTMQQKKYIVVRVVDEKLEGLAAHVLKSQSDQFEILRRIDEIYGLLVDLTG